MSNLESLLPLPAKLNEEEFLILGLITYLDSVLEERTMEFICRQQGIKLQDVRDITKRLNHLGFITLGSRYWNPFGSTHPQYYFAIALRLLESHPEQVAYLEKLYTQPSKTHEFLWRVAKAIHTQDPKLISNIRLFPGWTLSFIPYLEPLFGHKVFFPAFASLNPQQMEQMVHDRLDNMLLHEVWDEKQLANLQDVIVYYGTNEPKTKDHLSDLLTAYRFLFEGTKPVWKSKEPSYWTLCIDAIQSLYRGQLDAAGKLFEASLKLRNKTTENKNIYENPLLDFFLILYYAKANTPTTFKKANQFLNKSVTDSADYYPCRIIVKQIINTEDDKRLKSDIEYCLSSFRALTISKHLAALLTQYFGLADEVKKGLFKTTTDPRCALLRHELSPYFETTDRQQLEDRLGGKPILFSIHRKEHWESVIENLTAQVAISKEKSNSPAQRDTRIIYIISDYESMEPLEQHQLKSGAWSVGTRISTDKFMRQELDSMDETDKKIASASRSYSYYSIYGRYAIPQLIGSDRVFINSPQGRQPVEIVEEKPFIAIEKAKNCFVVKTNVPEKDEFVREKVNSTLIRRDSKTHFTVFRLTDFERKIIETLINLGTFPKQAEAKLLQFIEQISDKVEIHSDLLEGGSSLQKKEGLTRLLLRVVPDKETFIVSILAHPLDGGKLHLMPGMAQETVFDEADGERFQVSRNLEAEKANLIEIKGFIQDELLTSVSVNQSEMEPESLLGLLEFVSDHSDRFEMEWPEGKKLNLKAKLNKDMININLVSKENWFEVEGNITIGDNNISALNFLNLISQGIYHERFVKLNETDYIALTEQLAKYLRRLEGLAQQSHGKLHIPFYQVGALAEIVHNTDGSLKADKGIDNLVKKIEKAAKMKIAIPSALQAELRDYQSEGFKWIVRLSEWGAGACLADDMGLGKTVQTIAFLLHKAAKGPSLVVCPASVILNWANELARFSPTLEVKILNESSDRDALLDNVKAYDVVLTTYGLLVREEEALTKLRWNIVCLDEAHTIKNRGTKMSSSAMKLKAENRVILTGTPIQNYLSELWNLFQFLNPGLLGTFDSFMNKYIIPIERDGEEERRLQLKRMITPFMLRRTKAEVMDELPEKTEITRDIQLTDAEITAYETLREATEQALQSEDKVDVNILAQITKLRQAACSIGLVEKGWKMGSTKVATAVDLVEEIIKSKNSVLVFSQFTSFLSMAKTQIEERIGKDKIFYLDGSTTIRKREKMVADFQHGLVPVFLISLKAGGLGLNLTNANYVIHLDPWWNPAIEQQATDRAYRIGQNKNVTVYHLISRHTIEEKILRLHKTKRDLADSLLSGSNVSRAMTIDDLKFLVEHN
jgi:SNF2 family DNA or RNA helicase